MFKKIKTSSLLVVFLLFAEILFAQKNKTLALTLSPVALIDVYDGSSLRVGTDWNATPKIMFSLEVGTNIIKQSMLKINPSGYIIKPSFNVLVSGDEWQKHYVGLEFSHKEQKYGFLDSIVVNQIGYKKEHEISRKINCISLKYSYRNELGKKFYYDLFFGLGVRFTSSKSNLSQQELKGVKNDELSGVTQVEMALHKIGNYVVPNVLGGIKFGYYLF